MKDRQSIAINGNYTPITKSKKLQPAIPVNKISSLSNVEFVGMVADNPDQKIELKVFCAEIVNDHEALNREQSGYKELPIFSKVEPSDVLKSYLQVKKDVGMKTKGGMLRECANQQLEINTETMSCSHPSVRWDGEGNGHCGYCVPCIIRQAAFKAAGLTDKFSYRKGIF